MGLLFRDCPRTTPGDKELGGNQLMGSYFGPNFASRFGKKWREFKFYSIVVHIHL